MFLHVHVRVRRPAAGALLVAVLAAPAAPARADDVAAPPVDELVREALQRAPSVAARVAEVDAARNLEAPSGALPDPMLEMMVQDAGFPDWTVSEEPMSMVGPQVSQGVPFPGKRGARRRAAAADTAIRRAELERTRRDVALQVRRAYADVYAIDRELAILAASRDLADLRAATASHHVAMGEMDQGEAVKVSIAVARLEEEQADLRAARAEAVARLNRFLDRPGDAPFGEVTALPVPSLPTLADGAPAESSSVEVAVRAASRTAAEAQLRVARLETRPDFVLGAGVGFRGDLDPVASFRLGIELPLWQRGKQRPLVRAAAARLEQSRQEERDAKAVASADAARLRAAWARSDEQVARYEQVIVPQARLAFDAARASYVGARADFSAVLEDFGLWLDARRGLVRREAERFATWAELDALLHPAKDGGNTAGDEP